MNNDTIVLERPLESPQISFIDIENAAKSKLSSLERRKLELQQKKDELDAYYMNDDEYAKLEEDRKVIIKRRKTARERILNNPDAYKKHDEVKEVKKEIKNARLDLSDLLLQYEAESKMNVITADDGSLLPIIKSAKIAGK